MIPRYAMWHVETNQELTRLSTRPITNNFIQISLDHNYWSFAYFGSRWNHKDAIKNSSWHPRRPPEAVIHCIQHVDFTVSCPLYLPWKHLSISFVVHINNWADKFCLPGMETLTNPEEFKLPNISSLFIVITSSLLLQVRSTGLFLG